MFFIKACFPGASKVSLCGNGLRVEKIIMFPFEVVEVYYFAHVCLLVIAAYILSGWLLTLIDYELII